MLDALLVLAVKFLLWLRYRVRLRGLRQVLARGRRGILFLPNHPALIDPVILLAHLHRHFAPRALADRDQIDRPVVRHLARRIGARPMPDVAKYGADSLPEVRAALADCVEALRQGGNLVLYPSGRLLRSRYEDLGGNSAVEMVLRDVPDVRVVLVRTRGLWGSRFSHASGRAPRVGPVLKQGVLELLASGVFFAPRREVTIELWEPADLPRQADRREINRFLEDYYNADAPPNTAVPRTIWDRSGVRPLPEPEPPRAAGALQAVPAGTRRIVTEYLSELAGRRTVHDDDHLARDLGLDSLAGAELAAWLEREFGFSVPSVEALQTVGDVLLAACGEAAGAAPEELAPVPRAWFADTSSEPVCLPVEATITEAFLHLLGRDPGRVILADQAGGVRTCRDVALAAMLLKDRIADLPGQAVGIMLPASVAADVTYMAALFSGKTPVMVNWTAGTRNVAHGLELTGTQRVLTARKLLKRLESQGFDLAALADRFVALEDLAGGITRLAKLGAYVRSRVGLSSLGDAEASPTAVILFTSGSESLPKAVPLTHANILTNLRDVLRMVTIYRRDRLVGILPPFHSFGLTATVVLPLCAGVPVVHHPNPTESAVVAALIEHYRATALIGTPTFLGGIVRAAGAEQLATLRLAITGAEKCPQRVHEALRRRCPNLTILEGYGLTECSPIVSANPERAPRPQTIGRVLPSLTHAIVDVDTGRRAEPGRPGMLLVRGPSVFDGYLNYGGDPPFVQFEGATWFRTGDLVSADADGTLTFRGRLKRFVKLGGEMISLPAIEAVLEDHYVSDDDEGPVLAVQATAAEERPELVLFTTLELDRQEVNGHIQAAGLSPLHNIRRIVRLEEIPVLGTGKCDYRALAARLADEA